MEAFTRILMLCRASNFHRKLFTMDPLEGNSSCRTNFAIQISHCHHEARVCKSEKCNVLECVRKVLKAGVSKVQHTLSIELQCVYVTLDNHI